MILIFLFFKNILKNFINFIFIKEMVRIKSLIILNLEMMKVFFFKKFIFLQNFFKEMSEKNEFLILSKSEFYNIFGKLYSFYKFLYTPLKKYILIRQESTKWFYKDIFTKNNLSKFEDFSKKNLNKGFKFTIFKLINIKRIQITKISSFKTISIFKNLLKFNWIITPLFLYFFFKIFTYSLYLYNYYYIGVFFFYFLLHKTFFHLSKQYLNGKYTSQIQRFWKRSLSIFWFLETSLFLLFVFLTLISPSEQKYIIINFKEVNNYITFFNNTNNIIVYIFMLLTSTIIYIFILFFKKKKQLYSNKFTFYTNYLYLCLYTFFRIF